MTVKQITWSATKFALRFYVFCQPTYSGNRWACMHESDYLKLAADDDYFLHDSCKHTICQQNVDDGPFLTRFSQKKPRTSHNNVSDDFSKRKNATDALYSLSRVEAYSQKRFKIHKQTDGSQHNSHKTRDASSKSQNTTAADLRRFHFQ